MKWRIILPLVLVLAALAVLTISNWQSPRPRITAARNPCINNLRMMHEAKQKWARDHGKSGADTPTFADLVGENRYLRSTPVCPAGFTYTLHSVSRLPACTCPDHILQFYPDHWPLSACEENLLFIQALKVFWEAKQPKRGVVPTWAELFAANPIMRPLTPPLCPAGGQYNFGTSGEKPRCSIPGHTI